jgi:hypothetical protein
LWLIGAREPVYAHRSKAPTWFVALRTNDSPQSCARGKSILWSARSDFALIGAEDPYWTHFLIVAGATPPPLPNNSSVQDAYVARLRLFQPPRIALGLLKTLVATGLLSRPSVDQVMTDPSALGLRSDLMPSKQSIATLLGRPAGYTPVMVNFLEYHPCTPAGETGAAAYRRYGQVALRTVYRTGGALLFYGRVDEVVRVPKAGPTLGRWNELAAMRYPNPAAILSMESVPAYRRALSHRDAGLARSVVIATQQS